MEIPERIKTLERTCIYRNALKILFFPTAESFYNIIQHTGTWDRPR